MIIITTLSDSQYSNNYKVLVLQLRENCKNITRQILKNLTKEGLDGLATLNGVATNEFGDPPTISAWWIRGSTTTRWFTNAFGDPLTISVWLVRGSTNTRWFAHHASRGMMRRPLLCDVATFSTSTFSVTAN